MVGRGGEGRRGMRIDRKGEREGRDRGWSWEVCGGGENGGRGKGGGRRSRGVGSERYGRVLVSSHKAPRCPKTGEKRIINYPQGEK